MTNDVGRDVIGGWAGHGDSSSYAIIQFAMNNKNDLPALALSQGTRDHTPTIRQGGIGRGR